MLLTRLSAPPAQIYPWGMRPVTLLAAAILGAACARPAPERQRPPPAALPAVPRDSAVTSASSIAPVASVPLPPGDIVAARSTGVRWGKPPLKAHSFDVSLHNPAAAPRWLVLPSTFPYEGETTPAPGGAECEIQIFAIGPDTLFAYGVCAHFLAVHLAPGTTLALSDLSIKSWWHEIPDSTRLEVLVASDVSVGGAPLSTIVGAEVSHGGQLRAPEHAGDPRARTFWHPDGGDVQVSIQVESKAAIQVPLVKR